MQRVTVKPIGLNASPTHQQRTHLNRSTTFSGISSPVSLLDADSSTFKGVFLRQSTLFISSKNLNSCRADQLEEDQETSRHKTIGIGGAVLALIQTCVGSAVLTLPYSLSLTGLHIGVVLMTVGLLINAYTSYLLTQLGELLQKRSFEKMAVATFGPRFAVFLNLCLLIDSLISVIVYLVIIKNLVPQALIGILGESQLPQLLQSPTFWGALLASTCFLPLALLREFKSLQYLGFVGFLAIIYFVLLVTVDFFLLLSPSERQANLEASVGVKPDLMTILSALPIHMYAFSFQVNIPGVHLDLKARSLSRMTKVVVIVLALCVFIYGPIAIFGYLTQLEPGPVEQNILQSENYQDKTEFQIGIIIYVTMLLMTSTVRFRVGKEAVKQILWKGKKLGKCGNLLLTVGLVGVCMVFQLLVPNIAILMQILGSTTTPIVCFIGPILLFIKTQRGRCRLSVVMALVVVILVIALSALSFVSSLITTFT